MTHTPHSDPTTNNNTSGPDSEQSTWNYKSLLAFLKPDTPVGSTPSWLRRVGQPIFAAFTLAAVCAIVLVGSLHLMALSICMAFLYLILHHILGINIDLNSQL